MPPACCDAAVILWPMKASRWLLLATVVLLGVLLLAQFGVVSAPESPRSLPIEQESADVTGTAPGGGLLKRLQRESPMTSLDSDLFAPMGRSAARAARPSAPGEPGAAAFPYRYAGRLDVGRALKEAYLVRANGELVSVMPGAVVDGVWRIDRLTSEHVEVTYLPLRQSMALSLASLSGEPAHSASRLAQIERPTSQAQAASAIEVSAFGTARNDTASTVPLGLPAPTAVARLGDEAPAFGSMPTDTGMRGGAAPTGSFPSGPTPSGRLGEDTPAGKLGPR